MDSKTPEGDTFKIFYFKDPKYIMKIMASWMTLEEVLAPGFNTVFIRANVNLLKVPVTQGY